MDSKREPSWKPESENMCHKCHPSSSTMNNFNKLAKMINKAAVKELFVITLVRCDRNLLFMPISGVSGTLYAATYAANDNTRTGK